MNKRIETIRKLRAMAQQGTENERTIALQKMDALIKKYKISETEIDEDIMEEHGFTFKDKYEKRILIQVICMVGGNREVKIYSYRYGKGSKSKLYAECMKEEALQIEIAYEFYRDAWNEDVNTFLDAFIQTNELYSSRPRPEDAKKPSLKELEKNSPYDGWN